MGRLSNLKVLIVEDEELLRELLTDEFKHHGALPVTANEGRSAFALLEKDHFDFVISDIRMPGGDGVELLRRVQSLPSAPPVFICSGLSDLSRAELIEAGAADVFEKPFEFKTLLQRISAYLDKVQTKSR